MGKYQYPVTTLALIIFIGSPSGTWAFFYGSDYCSYPLISGASSSVAPILTATSKLSGRGPEHAIIDSSQNTLSWTPSVSNLHQYLVINLRKTKMITKLATLGFRGDYVSEFALSASLDGDAWVPIRNSEGNSELFKGNSDSDTIHVNDFATPIIAQYLRINPTRWHDRISLRVELYGCEYVPSTLSFTGLSLVFRNLTQYPIHSRRDSIRFRLRTSHPDGILMYSRGTQSDVFSLQLLNNRLVLNVNLGSMLTSITAGSLLDDNLWHDVGIDRYLNQIRVTVDRVETKSEIKGDFQTLDLDRVLYIGGVPTSAEPGLLTLQNFTGCLENLYVNDTNVIEKLKIAYYSEDDEEVYWKNNTFFNCPESNVVPITFLEERTTGLLKLKGYEGVPNFNVTLEFRTWADWGVIMYHKFSSGGFAKLYFEKNRLLIEIQTDNAPRLVLDNFPTESFNDGLWHRVIFAISTNTVILSVDEREVRTTRLIKMWTGGIYHFGGTPEATSTSADASGVSSSNFVPIDTSAHSQISKNALTTSTGQQQPTSSTLQSTNLNYVGCLRSISIDGNFQNPNDFDKIEGILMDSCQMIDRCIPNPCSHGSKCRQNSHNFECLCDENYTGATCHLPLYPFSCESYRYAGYGVGDFKREVTLDLDGSGPLIPFPVTCAFYSDHTETILHHRNEQPVLIDGYETSGSYQQVIEYDAGYSQIELLLNRSLECKQYLKVECRNARLFNSPSTSETFSPSSWWVSRQNAPMDYWGGSLSGSRKCECGITGSCELPEKWCNCDAGLVDTWVSDEGWLKEMAVLPVRSLAYGGTGTVSDNSVIRSTLGPLICSGDTLTSTPITFRLADAALQFPLYIDGHHLLQTPSWDIYFEFKTTTKNAVIVNARGPADFVKIEIINGNLIKFQVEAGGSGPLGVNVATSGLLSDDEWHSVSVEVNRKQVRLLLDGSQTSTLLQPTGSVTSTHRPIRLTTDLFVGSTTEYRDGYVGCIRSLVVNGHAFDLSEAAQRYIYGVGVGCMGKCTSSPCLNNGTCEEGYDRYTCDCRFTSFKGPICADEIGVNLQSNEFIRYDFRGSYKSTIAEKLRVGFTTTEPKGFLVGLSSNRTGEYLTLMVSNSGHLRLVFDFGFERQELIFPEHNFATGQYHDVQLSRVESGTKLIIKVDNLEPQIYTFDVKNSADAQFNNIEYLYIGKNESMREGFVGCISRVEFDDIYPLKYYFQEDRPKNIRSYPENILEDFCGVEPVTHPPELPESRPLPRLDEEKLRKIYASSAIQSGILGGVLAILFILIIIVAILIARQYSVSKGQYITQEDEGAAGADDPNEAVVKGLTGHHVGVKREWYI